jgi:hypothetical protein
VSDRIFRVTASFLNLREAPGRKARGIAVMRNGQAVARLDTNEWDGWWRIFADIPGQGVYDGYVNAEYLSPMSPHAPDFAPASPAPDDGVARGPVGDTAVLVPVAPGPVATPVRDNGTIKPLIENQLASIFGTFQTKPGSSRGRIEILGDWVRTNIIEIDTPVLAHTGVRKLQVHRKAAEPFRRVFASIEAAGLGGRILTCAGTWVPRHKSWNPENGLSAHTWGIAIDLNERWNPYNRAPAPLGAEGSLVELVPYFAAEGFAWGGHFISAPDGMHFELARFDL